MGYYGKLDEKIKAQELRRRGLSYKEILQHISVCKSTISEWCKDIPLSQEQKARLIKNKLFGQHKGSIVAADNKRKARIERTKTIFNLAKRELGKMSKRDRFIAGIALYAGEGDKADGKGSFANADPKIIRFMARWFQEFGHIHISKLRGAIWIHHGSDEAAAKSFWSNLTGIPENHFYKTYIAENKTNSKKVRKHIHPYGVFAIRFHNSDQQRKILGWISATLGGKITTHSPVAQR